MITLARVRFFCFAVLSLVYLTSSVNHHAQIALWLTLQGHSSALTGYYQFPNFFEKNLKALPNFSVESLALNGSTPATFNWSKRLLRVGKADKAKLYWQTIVISLTRNERLQLAQLLFDLNRWDDLSDLTEQGLVPQSVILEQVKLHLSYPPASISSKFASQAGFLLSPKMLKANSRCAYNVLMMSDHRVGLTKLDSFSDIYSLSPEPSENSFCFSEPVYLGNNIACQTNPLKAAACNWQLVIEHYVWPQEFDFIVMMSREGRGNVRGGVMQLSSKSSYQLFLHELMHFSGFEDEYAVPKSKQAWLCQQKGYVAPNLFIANNLSPPVGWYPSETCEGTAKSYKPNKPWSIMRYQQLPLSQKYRELWASQIHNQLYKPVRYHQYFTMLNQPLVLEDKRVIKKVDD